MGGHAGRLLLVERLRRDRGVRPQRRLGHHEARGRAALGRPARCLRERLPLGLRHRRRAGLLALAATADGARGAPPRLGRLPAQAQLPPHRAQAGTPAGGARGGHHRVCERARAQGLRGDAQRLHWRCGRGGDAAAARARRRRHPHAARALRPRHDARVYALVLRKRGAARAAPRAAQEPGGGGAAADGLAGGGGARGGCDGHRLHKRRANGAQRRGALRDPRLDAQV
mmetsp:Transcript_11866/g.25448  ORF Transcript_11866/g.25448 Transcript_11866/m.25448 type:complete len:228 (-) Transcript_11866:1029-1712(-)